MLRLGIISDETGHRNPRELFEYGVSRDIRCFELRYLYGKRVPNLSDDEMIELKSLIRDRGVSISAISPGLFKCSLYDTAMEEHTGTLLSRSLDFAEEFEVYKLIIFGVQRSHSDRPEDKERVLHILGEAAHAASKRGITICMENEPGWWADTPQNVYDILKNLESAGLWLNWDPGNLFVTGVSDYKPGYEMLKRFIRHVHAKDAVFLSNTAEKYKHVPLGQGSVRWDKQLADLVKDGYCGDISIETHCEPLQANSDINIEYIRKTIRLV
ncbi:MAG TPA: hypothetical protein DEB10_04615 [Ruminococcaceae bacterium]|nr:hypothetical protein [Oscillospiraceae bacterium]HCA28711.1 hypothetical protein [Oscillospiraceae bacterium]